jgi:hypothetical protein
MTRHSNSVRKSVKKRYQLEWQPVAIPLQPAEELHYIRELTRPTRALWTALDTLAIETIKKMLTDLVVVGVEVSLFCCLVFWRINGLNGVILCVTLVSKSPSRSRLQPPAQGRARSQSPVQPLLQSQQPPHSHLQQPPHPHPHSITFRPGTPTHPYPQCAHIVVPQQPEMELGVLEIQWGPHEMKSAPLEGASSTEWSRGMVHMRTREPAVWPCIGIPLQSGPLLGDVDGCMWPAGSSSGMLRGGNGGRHSEFVEDELWDRSAQEYSQYLRHKRELNMYNVPKIFWTFTSECYVKYSIDFH